MKDNQNDFDKKKTKSINKKIVSIFIFAFRDVVYFVFLLLSNRQNY
jgi:hypothetical protein